MVYEVEAKKYPVENWFERHAKSIKDKDEMSLSQRGGEVAAIVVSSLILAFFAAHQVWNTGFFTSSFGPAEMVLFYGAGLFGIATSFVRMAVGRRNAVRPLEVIGAVFWASASLWLLWVFPFNFANLGKALPSSLQFLLSWVPNPLGQWILAIAAVAGIAQAIYTTILYLRVRQLMKADSLKAKPSA